MPLLRVSKRSGGIRSTRQGGKRRRASIGYSLGNAGRQYLKTILNPSYGGAKIPDSFGAKTCTLQLQREVKIDAHQIAAPGGNAVYGMGGLLQVSPAAVVYGTAWNPANSVGVWSGNDFVEGPSLYANCKLPFIMRTARVVSAGLKVQFTGTTQNDKGTITVFAVDRSHITAQSSVEVSGVLGVTDNASIGNPDYIENVLNVSPIATVVGSATTAISGSNLRNLPINAYGPLRQGCVARYFPIDSRDLDFHPIPPSSLPIADATKPGTVAALGFFCEGTDSGASVICQYTVNLECTVRDDSFHLVSTESSPVDTRALAQCAMVYLKKPQVRVGSSMGDTESINVYSR